MRNKKILKQHFFVLSKKLPQQALFFTRKVLVLQKKEDVRKISFAVKDKIKKTGVFVDEKFDFIVNTAKFCKLDYIQLHGNENKKLCLRLQKKGFKIIKCLYLKDEPNILNAAKYNAEAYLIEHSKGKMPGGNALSWDFNLVKDFKKPFIIAGGLNTKNLPEDFCPDAFDISSGVEISPGVKDKEKIKNFAQTVSKLKTKRNLRRIFQ